MTQHNITQHNLTKTLLIQFKFKYIVNLTQSLLFRMSVNSNRQVRTQSNSRQNEKIKRLGLTALSSVNNKIDGLVALMAVSLKKLGYESKVRSNKKALGMSTSGSNKSLRGLRQITPSTLYNKINNDKLTCQKIRTIPVKNIKQRICGNGYKDQTKLNTTIAVKKSNQVTKSKQQKNMDKENNFSGNRHYYYNKDSKVTIKTNDKSDLLNFTSALNTHDSQSSIKIGQRQEISLDQFQIGRKLGKGRFGDVFMARQIRTGFALAIKMINKKQLKQSQMQKQLIQQIKIQMYSNHPNILKMYGFLADNNKIYLLLELATNGCLFKEIRKKGHLPQNLASFYFRQVTSGVRYLHSHSVIHRDIKPENILNCFNVLKLCDFGWAIYSPIYQRQTFCGTLDYVPPEIVTGQFYDQKADVWCLGVLCYELCTGKAPFQSMSDQNQTYEKILRVNIEFPICLSQQIVDFVGKILTRNPSERISLEEVQSHEWMKMYENQAGRMISKEIWDKWIELARPN